MSGAPFKSAGNPWCKSGGRARKHDGRQHELDHPAGLMADRAPDQLVHARHEMRPHLQQEDGQAPAPRRTASCGPARAPRLPCARRGPPRSPSSAFGRIARLRGGLQQVSQIDRAFGIGHGRGLGREVDVHVEHARHRRQRLVDATHAGGAGHGRHVQARRLRPGGIASCSSAPITSGIRAPSRSGPAPFRRRGSRSPRRRRECQKRTLDSPDAGRAGHVLD